MKRYKSYEDAKAAYPNCDAVVTTGSDWNGVDEIKGTFAPVYKAKMEGYEWTYCEGPEMIFPQMSDEFYVIATPPKPARTIFEKANYPRSETWKAFKEHQEIGHLFVGSREGYDCLGDSIFDLAMAISQGDQLYRKVEKEIDWADVTSEWVQENQSVNIEFLTDAVMYYHGSVSKDKFLEMCRVALRATGELK